MLNSSSLSRDLISGSHSQRRQLRSFDEQYNIISLVVRFCIVSNKFHLCFDPYVVMKVNLDVALCNFFNMLLYLIVAIYKPL